MKKINTHYFEIWGGVIDVTKPRPSQKIHTYEHRDHARASFQSLGGVGVFPAMTATLWKSQEIDASIGYKSGQYSSACKKDPDLVKGCYRLPTLEKGRRAWFLDKEGVEHYLTNGRFTGERRDAARRLLEFFRSDIFEKEDERPFEDKEDPRCSLGNCEGLRVKGQGLCWEHTRKTEEKETPPPAKALCALDSCFRVTMMGKKYCSITHEIEGGEFEIKTINPICSMRECNDPPVAGRPFCHLHLYPQDHPKPEAPQTPPGNKERPAPAPKTASPKVASIPAIPESMIQMFNTTRELLGDCEEVGRIALRIVALQLDHAELMAAVAKPIAENEQCIYGARHVEDATGIMKKEVKFLAEELGIWEYGENKAGYTAWHHHEYAEGRFNPHCSYSLKAFTLKRSHCIAESKGRWARQQNLRVN